MEQTNLISVDKTDLSKDEFQELQKQEAIIETGVNIVGKALSIIRDKRLYRDSHSSFEDYCQDRWGISKRHSNRLIQAEKVIDNLGPMGPTQPLSERQARELVKSEPEIQRLIHKEIQEGTNKATAKLYKEKATEYQELNQAVKEAKAKYSFDTEQELIEHAKTLLPAPNTSLVNELQSELSEKKEQIKIIYSQKEREVLQVKKDFEDKIDLLSKDNDSLLAEISELRANAKTESELKELTAKIEQYRIQTEAHASNLELRKRIIESLDPVKDIFGSHLNFLNHIEVNQSIKDSVRTEAETLSNMVNHWLTDFNKKFLNNNDIKTGAIINV